MSLHANCKLRGRQATDVSRADQSPQPAESTEAGPGLRVGD